MTCIILIVPVLYFFLNGNYNALFQKPKAKDIGIAVVLFAGYILYGFLINQ